MNQEPLLSVIIPVYNVETYLDKCLVSILAQEYANIEILLVDDGSTDDSSAICDKFVAEHNFIRVIHTANAGPATAKNRGYELARGKYISFIDSDDELRADMYVRMVECAEQTEADVVCCSYLQVDESGQRSHEIYSGEMLILNSEEGLKHLLEKNKIYSQCWTKMYRKEVLDKAHIRFLDGLKTEEDFIYNLYVFLNSRKVAIVDEPFYIYTHRESSLSREYYKSHLTNFLANMTKRLQLTDSLVKIHFPSLAVSCTVHCIQYYNLMIGRAAQFSYHESIPYLKEGIRYIKQHRSVLLAHYSRCGLSKLGAWLYVLLPPRIYFQYRKTRTRS